MPNLIQASRLEQLVSEGETVETGIGFRNDQKIFRRYKANQ
ncbi:hypothetical protein SAMN06265219_115101 [Gracilimonas mengyeensis]|uniref:Uncharacterized protein n=1 Tax=Gracilimonas mengyeensis TaxID=1302730 RepID=A0A521F648_9BACT|nr:hypothetical protein SAMN06265219_115101 [Gracilimonas mengyeensis]